MGNFVLFVGNSSYKLAFCLNQAGKVPHCHFGARNIDQPPDPRTTLVDFSSGGDPLKVAAHFCLEPQIKGWVSLSGVRIM